MQLHKYVNRLFPLTHAHFEQWYLLFSTTVDELFAGVTASLVKQRAKSVAMVMQIKILNEPSSTDKIC